jgi:LysR family cys regulon transcriptional activator
MHITQLEAVRAIAKSGFNMSAAAEILNRSQSGLSRQVKELEGELGVRIFARTKNSIVGLTPQGEEILRIGQRMLSDAENLRRVGTWASAQMEPELRIATTHVHARYFLPPVLKSFTARFPETLLTLQQRDPVDCCSAVAEGEVDMALATVDERLRHKIVAVPSYLLTSGVYVPKKHPLAREKTLTLKKLAEFPFIAYSPAFAMRMTLDDTFAKAGLRPRIVCTATDADVCKAYVEAGMGIAILAKLAFDPVRDTNLTVLDVDSLIEPSVLCVAFRKNAYLGRSLYAFVSTWAPHLGQQAIRLALEGATPARTSRTSALPKL